MSQINMEGGYVPVSATKPKNPIALGWYPCHIVDCDVKTTAVRQKYRAKIYNPLVEVAKEVKDFKFTINDISGNQKEVTGEDYEGKNFRSMGVFYFLNPQVGDDFEVYPKGNVGYMYFCQALGLKLDKATIKIDGVDSEVLKLPELSRDEIIGLPILACVGKSKPWKGRNGETRTSFEVKAFKPWEDAKKKDVIDDIPF